MATKENPGEFDCYAAAAPDEPIFVLRANDELAPATVRYWAGGYLHAKQGELTAEQAAKFEEAHKCAGQMEAWKRENPTPPKVERCEGGCAAPVVFHDREGIPLCVECAVGLAEAQNHLPVENGPGARYFAMAWGEHLILNYEGFDHLEDYEQYLVLYQTLPAPAPDAPPDSKVLGVWPAHEVLQVLWLAPNTPGAAGAGGLDPVRMEAELHRLRDVVAEEDVELIDEVLGLPEGTELGRAAPPSP